MKVQKENKNKRFNFFRMFYEGITNLSPTAKTLWIIAIIKLIIMFLVLRLIFFSSTLGSKFSKEEDKIDHVREQLTDPTTAANE